ncbi:MAG: energy-dependent translational throttle protein EttA [Oligoflexales bacterium]|nr:energy-dependent translational throttle protein EttA [Oligoflexales bacterium]
MSTVDDKKIIYSMVKVGKVHGTKDVLKGISLSYFYGAKIGVLGLNGSGKSTLLRIMAGVETNFIGEAHLSPGYSVGYLEQEPHLDGSLTVKEIVSQGVKEVVDLLARFDRINEKFADPDLDPDAMEKLIVEQAYVQDQLDKTNAWSLDDKLQFAMEALRCPPSDQKVSELSGGERRRVALCRLLLQEPDILLLDEPTNHLDAQSVAWLEKHLQAYKGTVIAVTHDRYFLDNVAGWILELDRGQGIPYRGNYSGWLEQKQKRLDIEAKGEDKRQKFLERELEWIRMSPRARQAKSKARIGAYENMLEQEQEQLAQDLKIYIPPGPRLGNVVIEAQSIAKTYGPKLLYKDLSFNLPPGGIVGVVGPNGAGKTTLFRLMTGEEKPDSGTFRTGSTVKLGYMEQLRSVLDTDKTVYELISGGAEFLTIGKREVNARAYVSQFNFVGTDQQKLVKSLSGGEKNRVQLALLLKEGANLILLDEPSNDLDVHTLRALEEALLNFAGCAVIISHDRWFLDRVATHILAFEGDSEVYWFDGHYTDYEQDFKRRKGTDALTPRRIRYQGVSR